MKTKLILGLCLLIMTQNVYGQRKASNAAAAGAAVALVGAAIYYEQQMRENVEQSAVEWALDNFPIAKGDIFLPLIQLQKTPLEPSFKIKFLYLDFSNINPAKLLTVES